MSITTPNIAQGGNAWETAPERFPLFTITAPDGTETVYDMPRAKHPGIVMQYLREARKYGDEIATGWLLERVLGEAVYTTLLEEPDLTFETINAIGRAAVKVLTGRAPAIDPTPAPTEGEAADPLG